jgi:hypothetical protein
MSKPNAISNVRSMMRYIANDNVFEYKIDETTETIRLPEEKMSLIAASLGSTDEAIAMAKVFNFLFENAKKSPGVWVEASSEKVSSGQALV